MSQEYEENEIAPPLEFQDPPKPRIIKPPLEFRDDYEPKTKPRIIKPPLEFRDDYEPPIVKQRKDIIKPPIPKPRTKITQLQQALKGSVKSYEVSIKNEKDPLVQLNSTNNWIENYLKRLLKEIKGFKLVETFKVSFKKPQDKKTIHRTAYFNSKPLTITNDVEIEEILKLVLEQMIKKIACSAAFCNTLRIL